MSGLPRISGRECVKILEKFGFRFIRQHGSHIILRRDEPFSQTTVPNHKELDRGTLHSILRQSGISPEEFSKHT